MKKFLFALLLLPFISKAQVLPIGAAKGTVRVLGKLSSDTLLILPNSDTTTAPKVLGGVIMNTSDKKIYVYTGTKWAATSDGALVTESDPTVPAFLKLIVPADTVRWAATYVDSVKRVGLNVYTYKNGAATLAYTDSIANVSGKLDSVRRSRDSVYWYAGGSRFFAFIDSVGGEANIGANVGSGAQVFQAKVGLELRFKTILSANGNITITPGTNDITLTGKSFVDSLRKKAGTDSVFSYTNGVASFSYKDSAIAGGEINTISSVGSGTSVVKGKTGVDLQLKSLTSDTTIAITGNTNDVQIKVDQTRIASVGRLADTATALRAVITAGDTIYVGHPGAGTRIGYIQGDTLQLKRLQAGTNVTLTQNADSSITIAASGGGGSPGGSNTQVQFNNSGAFGGDAGLTYNSTTNQLNTDSIVMNNISLQRMLRNFGGGIASDSIGLGFCVIRGDATGGGGSLISWSFIDDADHTKTYFTQVQGKSSGNTIHVSFPDAGKLLSFVAVPDEALAGRGVFIGSSVADTAADIYVYQHILSSGYLQGNGTSYDKNGHISGWTVNYNSGTGTISVLPPANLYYSTTQDPPHISAHYAGSNNYRLRRVLSGLGSDIAGWRVVDIMSNTDVTGSPTTSDIIEITGLPFYRQVNAYQVGGNLYEASIFTVSANIWIMFSYKK